LYGSFFKLLPKKHLKIFFQQRFLNNGKRLHVLTINHGEVEIMREEKKNERCVLTGVIETELDILKRHIHILKTLQKNQPMGIIKLAELTGYPQHMVRYSLRILEQDDLIEPSSHGAITTRKVEEIMKILKKTLQHIRDTADELMKKIE